MNTKEKTSEQIGEEIAASILAMPLAGVQGNLKNMVAGIVEAVRCESVNRGVEYKGKENLANGTVRLHCLDGDFIIPYFQKNAIKAVTALHGFHDFSAMPVANVMQLINNKIAANGNK